MTDKWLSVNELAEAFAEILEQPDARAIGSLKKEKA